MNIRKYSISSTQCTKECAVTALLNAPVIALSRV